MGDIKDTLAEINKLYGKGTILPASEATGLVVDRISTGIFDLDMKIGGGYPRGRITMLKGEYSTGKTVLGFLGVANAQRSCRFCGTPFEAVDFYGEIIDLDCDCGKREPMRAVWMDAEHSLDSSWAAKWGIDPEDMLVIRSEYAEQAIDVAEKCIRSQNCDFLVIDSIASLTPGVEVEESVSADSMVFLRDRANGGFLHVSIDRAHDFYQASPDQWETLAHELEGGFCWRRVKSVWKAREDTGRRLFEIKTAYGKELKVTGSHSVYRLNLGREYKNEANTIVRDGELGLVRGSDLRVGDYLLSATDFDLEEQATSWSLRRYQDTDGNAHNQCHVAHTTLLEKIDTSPKYSRDRSRYREGAYGPHLPLRDVESLPADSLLYYTGRKASTKAEIPADRMAYLIGAYLGDGSMSKNQISLYVGNVKHEEIFRRIQSDLSEYVFPGPYLRPRKDKTDFIVHLGCKPLGVCFSFLFGGATAKTKRFPLEVWSWPRSAKRSLIEGWLATDGHVVPGIGRAMITTTSKGMALDGVALLANLGVDAGIQEKPSSESVLKDGRVIPSSTAYVVTFSMLSFNKVNEGRSGRRNSSVRVPFGVPVKIKSIQEVPSETVYDMEVEGASNFVANGVLVHNSAEKQQIGVFARLMNKALRKWTSAMNSYGLLADTKCTILLINQMRLNLGGYHPTPTSPGGKGLDFYESVDVKFKSLGLIENPEIKRPIGVNVEYVVKKNKTAPPMTGGQFALYFVSKKGSYRVGSSDIDMQVVRLAAFWGMIEKKGSWFHFPSLEGTPKVQGEDKAAMLLRDNPKMLELLMAQVRSKEIAWAEKGDQDEETVDEDA